MANNYQNIILYGFDDIKIKQEGQSEYQPLIGGISVQVDISVENITATNKTDTYVIGSNIIAEGQLTLLELSLDHRKLLFGHKIEEENGMRCLVVKDTDKCPRFSLKFSRTKANGKKIIYQIPSVSFSENSIQANTVKNGEIEEDNITISFEIYKVGDVLYRIYEEQQKVNIKKTKGSGFMSRIVDDKVQIEVNGIKLYARFDMLQQQQKHNITLVQEVKNIQYHKCLRRYKMRIIL